MLNVRLKVILGFMKNGSIERKRNHPKNKTSSLTSDDLTRKVGIVVGALRNYSSGSCSLLSNSR